MRCAHPMRFGATVRAQGGTDFRLWAPAAKQLELALYEASGAAPHVLPARLEADGWWQCGVEGAGEGQLYHWRVDGELSVPDPASRDNPLGVHEPSRVVAPLAFDWGADWNGRPWNEVVLYELHIGAFTPEGTFAAAAARLPELADLGVTAIELMPLADFPGRFGWGYDGVLPFAPHAAYGTPGDLKRFVQQAHQLGLMVFLDVVYNHFGPEGNYLHRYAPQFFSPTRSSPWGAAINFDGEGSRWVREFFIDNAVYWLTEYRMDGLRLDAVHAIHDAGSPDLLQELSARVRAATAGRHVHLVLENENNHHHRLATRPEPGRYDGQWNDDFHHALHVALTGEAQGYYHDYAHAQGETPLDLLGRCLTHGMLFEDSARKPGGAREKPVPAPPVPLGTLVNFAHNHDQVGNRAFGERLAELAGPDAAPLATLLALLTPAIPMLFLGEESGSTQPWLYFADWTGELKKAVQEGRQREFGHVSKVVDGRALPLPDPCSAATFEASRPAQLQRSSAQGRQWMAMVRDALAARRRWITPRHGRLLPGRHTMQRMGDGGLAVQWRYDDGHLLSLQINLGSQAVQGAPAAAAGHAVFQHHWPADTPAGTWPAWAARWRLGQDGTS